MENMDIGKVAVLGATSSIFKSLVGDAAFFPGFSLHLFSRSPEEVPVPRRSERLENLALSDFLNSTQDFDYLLNFVGTGDPQMSAIRLTSLISASLTLDDAVMSRLRAGSLGEYFYFSSGSARYAQANSRIDSYQKLKAHLELNHRASGLDVVDIRIFGFADSRAKFFPGSLVGDIKNAIITGETLVTERKEVVRDYIGSEELVHLLNILTLSKSAMNVVEPHSLEPLKKNFLLQVLEKEHIIKTRSVKALAEPISGLKPNYVPETGSCPENYNPKRSSIEVVFDALGLG